RASTGRFSIDSPAAMSLYASSFSTIARHVVSSSASGIEGSGTETMGSGSGGAVVVVVSASGTRVVDVTAPWTADAAVGWVVSGVAVAEGAAIGAAPSVVVELSSSPPAPAATAHATAIRANAATTPSRRRLGAGDRSVIVSARWRWTR